METLVDQFIKVVSINIVRYFILAGIPFILFYLVFPDKLTRFKIQLKHATSSDFFREILHSIQTTFVFGGIAVLVLFTPISHYTQVYKDVNAYPIWWIPVSLVLSLVLHDTYFYWMHRLMHQGALYKRVHLVHHKSIVPSPWTSYSFHFLEAIIEGLAILPILIILPMHGITIALFITFGFAINVYGHLGYEILPNNFRKTTLFKILNTSVYHDMHHSHVQGNYSLYFRHWDKWMKTENVKYEPYFDKVMEKREEGVAVSNEHSIGIKKA